MKLKHLLITLLLPTSVIFATSIKSDTETFSNGMTFNFPVPDKFIDAYPYNKKDHKELPPASPEKIISYVLKSDLNNFISGKGTSFSYQSVLAWGHTISRDEFLKLIQDSKADEEKFLRFLIGEYKDPSTGTMIKTKITNSELVINKDNAIGYLAKITNSELFTNKDNELEVGFVMFTLKERLFIMMLANGDLTKDRLIKEDLIEWTDLILAAQK